MRVSLSSQTSDTDALRQSLTATEASLARSQLALVEAQRTVGEQATALATTQGLRQVGRGVGLTVGLSYRSVVVRVAMRLICKYNSLMCHRFLLLMSYLIMCCPVLSCVQLGGSGTDRHIAATAVRGLLWPSRRRGVASGGRGQRGRPSTEARRAAGLPAGDALALALIQSVNTPHPTLSTLPHNLILIYQHTLTLTYQHCLPLDSIATHRI